MDMSTRFGAVALAIVIVLAGVAYAGTHGQEKSHVPAGGDMNAVGSVTVEDGAARRAESRRMFGVLDRNADGLVNRMDFGRN
ncbi:MAG: hypothetical protein KJZ59_10795 [Pararhodobacter sp.]|nr:hypothetical protein [Pararhodobacter sp.]